MNRSRSIAGLLITGAVLVSCNLDTTPPNELPHFSPAWQLVSIDGQPLPDTLALALENSAPGTQHTIEAGAIEFVFPAGRRVLHWTLILLRLTDSLHFEFSFDANYVQIGADSLQFPLARTVPPDFFGGKRADTLSIVTIWNGDSTTASTLVGGSHTWRFLRDTAFQ
jgi:hypothetical protein